MVFEIMVAICLDFKWLGFRIWWISKSKSFATQTFLDHSKYKLVQILDLHCKIIMLRSILLYNMKMVFFGDLTRGIFHV